MTDPAVFERKADKPRLELAEHRRRVWDYIATTGTTVADLLQPSFWGPCHTQLAPWDKIEVREESGAFYAEFVVLSSISDQVRVAALKGIELEGVGARGFNPINLDGAQVVYRGPFHQWSVMRGGQVMRDGFAEETDAARWLADYLRTAGL